MQILDESWARESFDFASQYLSEKTFGLILAGIPFISTHEYPLDILQKIFKLEPHPFYNEIKKSRIDRNYFITFIKEFLNNFEENYTLCKTWTDMYHTAFMDKINNENCLFDLIINDFKKDIIINNTNLI